MYLFQGMQKQREPSVQKRAPAQPLPEACMGSAGWLPEGLAGIRYTRHSWPGVCGHVKLTVAQGRWLAAVAINRSGCECRCHRLHPVGGLPWQPAATKAAAGRHIQVSWSGSVMADGCRLHGGGSCEYRRYSEAGAAAGIAGTAIRTEVSATYECKSASDVRLAASIGFKPGANGL